MGTMVRLPFQPRRFDLPDLLSEQTQPRQLAPQLSQCVLRHRFSLRCAQPLEPLRSYAQGRFEAADPKLGECALDPVPDARALADEVLALASWPLGVLRFLARDGRHPAVVSLASQPTRKARFSSCVSRRSVFARRCSREPAMLFAWITCASIPCARSQRASR
jgi:hypothetical protein